MKKDRTYEIELSGLADGLNEFEFHVDTEKFARMEVVEVLGADVDVHADIDKRHGGYRCRLDFEGELQVACDRCLDPVTVPVSTDYEVTVKHGEEFDDSDDELLVLPWNMNRLDLWPMIYDSLMLSIPIRCVHDEGECNAAMRAALSEHRAGTDEEENDCSPASDETAG